MKAITLNDGTKITYLETPTQYLITLKDIYNNITEFDLDKTEIEHYVKLLLKRDEIGSKE